MTMIALLLACAMAGPVATEPLVGDEAPDDPEVTDTADTRDTGDAQARAPAVGELVITEIMDNPDPTDDDLGEWLELTNVGDDTLALAGLALEDLEGERHVLQGDLTLAPGAFLVLAASADPDVNGGFVPDGVFDREAFHLGNDADAVLLRVGDTLIDAVVYDDRFPEEAGKSRSLDRDATDAEDNDDAEAWCEGDGAYGDGDNQGTPGTRNDACP